MGLDQYIEQVTKKDSKTFQELKSQYTKEKIKLLEDASEEEISILNNQENHEQTMIEQISKELRDAYNLFKQFDKCLDENFNEFAQFRKVNSLQNYFETKYNLGNCEMILILEEDIDSILNSCSKLIFEHDYKTIIDRKSFEKLAATLFPTTTGFCYGSTSYDDHYIAQIRDISETFTELKKSLHVYDYYYHSWY